MSVEYEDEYGEDGYGENEYDENEYGEDEYGEEGYDENGYGGNPEDDIWGMIYTLSLIDDEENENMPAVISDLDEYELPDHKVRGERVGGGSCATAFLKVLDLMKAENGSRKKKMTWAEALEEMHDEIELSEEGRRSLPVLSTSRPINVRKENLRIVNNSKRGVKRALLVGLHYQDEPDQDVWLKTCHRDIRQMRHHLIHQEGFEKSNILTLLDDDRHCEPNKGLILNSLLRMCQISEAGDSIFVHFSGHGGMLMNEDEYVEQGITHQLLAPRDFREEGVITDDELYSYFVTQIPEGVQAVVIIDTCHPMPSRGNKASALDLPYICEAGDKEVRPSEGFHASRAVMASAAAGAGAGIGAGAAALASKRNKSDRKVDDEGEDELDDSGYIEEPSERSKSKKKTKSKKKKSDPEEVTESEAYDNSYEAGSDDGESPKSKKKSKKKKKKGDPSQNEEDVSHSEAGQEETKSKKKKKKTKKK